MSRAIVRFSKTFEYSSDEYPEARAEDVARFQATRGCALTASRCVVKERAGALLPSSPIPPRQLHNAKPAAPMDRWLPLCIHADGYGR